MSTPEVITGTDLLTPTDGLTTTGAVTKQVEMETAPFAKRRVSSIRQVVAFFAYLFSTICAAFWWVIAAIALRCRMIANINEHVELQLNHVNNCGLLPSNYEKKREFVEKVAPDTVPALEHVDLPDFNNLCDELHDIEPEAVDTRRLPALNEPPTDRDAELVRMTAGLDLMTGDVGRNFINNLQLNPNDVRIQDTMQQSGLNAVDIDQIPAIFRQFNIAGPIDTAPFVQQAMQHASPSQQALIMGAQMLGRIPRQIKLDDIPGILRGFGITGPQDLSSYIADYIASSGFSREIPQVDGLDKSLATLDFMIETLNSGTLSTDSHAQRFQANLRRMRNYQFWFSKLKTVPEDVYHPMKRDVLAKIKDDLSEHHQVFIPFNKGREILQLRLETDTQGRQSIRGELILRNDNADDHDLIFRLRRIEEERLRIKNIVFGSIDYKELAESPFMEQLLDGCIRTTCINHSDMISLWPGAIDFEGQEHTFDSGENSNLLALMEENLPSRQRATAKLMMYRKIVHRIDDLIEEIPEPFRSHLENSFANIPEASVFYKKVLRTIDKYKDLGIPETLKNELAELVIKRARMFAKTIETEVALPAQYPSNDRPARHHMVNRSSGPSQQRMTYDPVRWDKLPAYRRDLINNTVVNFIRDHSAAEQTMARLWANKLRELTNQQVLEHRIEQLPDPSHACWNPENIAENAYPELIDTLIDTLTEFFKHSFYSARAVEDPSTHDSVLALKLFAIIVKLQNEHDQAHTDEASGDLEARAMLIQHYATGIYDACMKTQKFQPVLSVEDRVQREKALQTLKTYAMFDSNGQPDKKYLLLRPADVKSHVQLVYEGVRYNDWYIGNIEALGSNTSDGSDYNKEMVIFQSMIKKHMNRILRTHIMPKINPSNMSFHDYRQMIDHQRNKSVADERQCRIIYHVENNDYDAISNDPELTFWIMKLIYDGNLSRRGSVHTTHDSIDNQFNTYDYPEEMNRFFRLRDLHNAMHNMYMPCRRGQMRHHETERVDNTEATYTFKHVKPYCRENETDGQYYLSAGYGEGDRRRIGDRKDAITETRTVIEKQLGQPQNAFLVGADGELEHPLWTQDRYWEDDQFAKIPPEVITSYREQFQHVNDLSHFQALTFLDKFAHFMHHPTLAALFETTMFSETLPNPSVGRKAVIDLVVQSDADATLFLDMMDPILRKMKINERRPPKKKYTGNYSSLTNTARLRTLRILAGAINHMRNPTTTPSPLSPRVIERAERLLTKVWREELNTLPQSLETEKEHLQHNHTLLVLLSTYPYLQTEDPHRLKTNAVKVLNRILTDNTWRINFDDYVQKYRSAEIGQCANDAIWGWRLLESDYLRFSQTGQLPGTASTQSQSQAQVMEQIEFSVQGNRFITIPSYKVPSVLKEAFTDTNSEKLLTTITFCCDVNDPQADNRIVVIDNTQQSIIGSFYLRGSAQGQFQRWESLPNRRQTLHPVAMKISGDYSDLSDFATLKNKENVSLLWSDPSNRNKPLAMNTLNSEWQFQVDTDGHWYTTNYPDYIITDVSEDCMHLVSRDNPCQRKKIIKHSAGYYSYDTDNKGNVTGYPDGIESMPKYIELILRQDRLNFHDIDLCQNIINRLTQGGNLLNKATRNDIKNLLVDKQYEVNPFVCTLLLKLAAAYHHCNPHHLKKGDLALPIKLLFSQYLSIRKMLDEDRMLTHDDETTLMTAMLNHAKKQTVPIKDREESLSQEGICFLIPRIIIERCRYLDPTLHRELDKWTETIGLMPDWTRGSKCTERCFIKKDAHATDLDWYHNLRLPFHGIDTNALVHHENDPVQIYNMTSPSRERFTLNFLFYYKIARNTRHPKHQQLKQFLANIESQDESVKKLTLFLQLVMERPSYFKAYNRDGIGAPPRPEAFGLPADYDDTLDPYLEHGWSRYSQRLSKREKNYLREKEFHPHKQTLQGQLSWYYWNAYWQNSWKLDAQMRLKTFDRRSRLLSKSTLYLPVMLPCRLHHTDPPPCEEVKYTGIDVKSRNEEDAQTTFEGMRNEVEDLLNNSAADLKTLLVQEDENLHRGRVEQQIRDVSSLREQMEPLTHVGDKCSQSCIKRILDGFDTHIEQLEEQQSQPKYHLGKTCRTAKENIAHLTTNIGDRLNALNARITGISDQLTERLADFRTAPNKNAAIRHHIKSNGAIPLSTLIAIIGKGDPTKLAALHPEWTHEECIEVFNLGIEYLLCETEKQHAIRILALVHKLAALLARSDDHAPLPDVAITAQEQLVTMIHQERAYSGQSVDNKSQLEFLLFEYIQNIRVRKDQIESCQKLESKDKINAEIPTGSGKSTIILPYLCYKALLDGQLPILVVPSDLIEQQKEILRKGICKAFSTELVEFHFERTLARDPDYIDRMLLRLKSAHRDKKIVLCRMNELHAVISLERKELLHLIERSDQDTSELLEALKKLDELQLYIEDNGRGIIDESKTCFNPNHSYDYAVGTQAAQPATTREAIKHLFTLILEVLSEEYKLDFMPGETGSDSLITRENYKESVAPKLADRLVPHFTLPVIEDIGPELTELINTRLTKDGYPFNPENLKLLIRWAMHNDLSQSNLEPDVREILDRILKTHPQRELYATLRLMISTMGQTLTRKIGDSYGLNDDTTRVIPFTNGIPNPKAEFASPEMNIILTAQAFMQKTIDRDMMRKWSADLSTLEEELPPEEVVAHPQIELFNELKRRGNLEDEIATTSLTDVQINHVCEVFNQPENLDLKLEYLCEIILPEMKLFTRKVNSSAFNIVSAFKNLRTASGTVDPNVLPNELETIEAKEAVIPNLLQLLQGRWDAPASPIPKTTTEEERLLRIARQHRGNATVIIDAGDCFRSLSHTTIAESLHREIYQQGNGWLNTPMQQTRGIMVFDAKGIPWVKKREGGNLVLFENCGIKAEHLTVIMKKAQTEGTDQKMHQNAHAVVTVDITTDLPLCIQAIGRMRQLTKGQSVELAYMEEQEELLKRTVDGHPCSYGELIQHMAKIESQRITNQAIPLMNNYLRNSIERIIYIDYLRDNGFSQSTIMQLIKDSKEFMVPTTQIDPMDLISSERETISLEAMAERIFEEYRPLLERLRRNHRGLRQTLDIETLHTKYMNFVRTPERVLPTDVDTLTGAARTEGQSDSTVEVTVTQKKEQEVEKDVTPATTPSCLDYKPYDTIEWDGNFIDWCKDHSPDFHIGNAPVFLGPNTKLFAKSKSCMFGRTNPLNHKYQKPIYQAVVFKRTGEHHWSLFIGDISDMAYVKKDIDQKTVKIKPPEVAVPLSEESEYETAAETLETDTLPGIDDGCFIHAAKYPYRVWGDGQFLNEDYASDEKSAINYFLKLAGLSGRYRKEDETQAFEHFAEAGIEISGMVDFLERISNGYEPLAEPVKDLKNLWNTHRKAKAA